MKKLKLSGPVVTLGAAAALGIGLFSVNVAKEAEPTPPPAPVAASVSASPSPSSAAAQTSAAPTPSSPETTSTTPTPFPASADYVADIPTASGTIVLEIAVSGATATAYACDNIGIEQWLAGSAESGTLDLASDDQTSQLDGQLRGNAVVGTLTIGDKDWDFTAAQVQGADDVR